MSRFGFILEYLPDFLADHTLLGESHLERINEHLRRWCQVVSSLWAPDSSGVVLMLRFDFQPSRQGVEIYLLGRAADPLAASILQFSVESALRMLGFSPVVLEDVVVGRVLGRVHDHVFEVRQFEREVSFVDIVYSGQPSPHYCVSPWWGPAGTFLFPFSMLATQEHESGLVVMLRPRELASREADLLARYARVAKSSAGSMHHLDDQKTIQHHQSDPQAEWAGQLFSANWRRLDRPFLAAAYAHSTSRGVAHSLAQSLASAVQEDTPPDPPIGEAMPIPSRAEIVELHSHDTERVRAGLSELSFTPTSPTLCRLDSDEERLRYLMDARGACTLFRFPVNVRGGVPGISVRQPAPDYRPGKMYVETGPPGIFLGSLESGGPLTLPVPAFASHALITGFTGSGKTNTVFHVLTQLWRDHRVPFLVIEPAKTEYRSLLEVDAFKGSSVQDGVPDLRVYTLGNEACAPFRLNPFELVPGVRLETHINRLNACFQAVLPQDLGPVTSVIEEAIAEVYLDHGWAMTEIGPGLEERERRVFPTMTDLHDKVREVIEARKYSDRYGPDLIAALCGRLRPFTTLMPGSRGRMFDTQSSLNPELIFEAPCVLELNDLNHKDKSLVILFLLNYLREYREVNVRTGAPHITVVEEAHNVIEAGSSLDAAQGRDDTRHKAVEFFCNLLSEVRALGEGIIIADQSPSKIAADALKNTNIQIAHQLRDSVDREAVARAMLMTKEQEDFIGKLLPGRAALFHTGLEQATFIRVPEYRPLPGDMRPPRVHDTTVRLHMAQLTQAYQQIDLPFGDRCETCPDPCLAKSSSLRRAVLVSISDSAAERDFAGAYTEWVASHHQRTKTERDTIFLDLALRVCFEVSTHAGYGGNDRAAYCAFLHLVQATCRNSVLRHFSPTAFAESYEQARKNGAV